ncbi:MAG: helix-turn-helix domain-containing protein [Chloroflexi bacterium]|nr:helix-turn-helix domain-containing protein [Chloroflexota bacterium]
MEGKHWAFLAGLSGLVVYKNPPLQDWLVEFLQGLYKDAPQHEQPPEPLIMLPSPTQQPRPDYADTDAIIQKLLDTWGEKNTLLQPPAPEYTPAIDENLARLVHHPSVILILGHRGNGKTGLAIRLQELLRDVATPYAVGLPAKASGLLPSWYGLSDDFDTIPNNAVIYVPESYRLFHARDTQSAQGRTVAELVNLSRHRKHTLIFDVQNAAQLDRNIISEVDMVLVKEPGPFQEGFERSQFHGVMNSARAAFAGVGKSRKKRAVWVVAPTAGINGQLMENQLPTFWSEPLSRIFGDASISLRSTLGAVTNQGKASQPISQRRGQRTTTEAKREKAKQMHASGYTYGEIAATLGISRSYAYKLVNG